MGDQEVSVIFTVYIGPYAEWLLAKVPAYPEELSSLLTEQEPRLDSNGGKPPRITVGGAQHYQVCWYPSFPEHSAMRPPRPMDWSDWDCKRTEAVVDLGGVSMTEEIAWFAQICAGQLAALVRYYGKPFHVRWGVLTYAQ
jgi:hypothetical protein